MQGWMFFLSFEIKLFQQLLGHDLWIPWFMNIMRILLLTYYYLILACKYYIRTTYIPFVSTVVFLSAALYVHYN